MKEYEIEITVEDDNKERHIIKRYYVCSIVGSYQLKSHIDKLLKQDEEIKQYKLIDYIVLNWK